MVRVGVKLISTIFLLPLFVGKIGGEKRKLIKLIREERIGISFRRIDMRQKMKCIKKK